MIECENVIADDYVKIITVVVKMSNLLKLLHVRYDFENAFTLLILLNRYEDSEGWV